MRLPHLSPPRLSRGTKMIAAVAILVLAAGGTAAWFFLVREDAESPTAGAVNERERKEPLSKDPVVRKLSVAEQVDQVLMLGFSGDPASVPSGLGAVLVRAENGLGSAKELTKGSGEVPPLVVASQEGGEYSTFPDLPPDKRALDVGREGDPEAAEAWAKAASGALKNSGFHLNLFPVADVASLDSPLAGRAFSDDPAVVAELTRAALDGCEAAELACAPLHFPGLGSASQDTAEGPATVVTDLATLMARDLVPFATAAKKAPAMVLSLAFYPDFDAVVPGALTAGVATGLLRDEVGFEGVAISDDLSSGAVQATGSTPEAAVAALAAGVDLIQISSPENAKGVAEALKEAVNAGDVPPERLAEAVERVLDLKREVGLIKN
jgi:beta-N-acetylhexosaminidase